MLKLAVFIFTFFVAPYLVCSFIMWDFDILSMLSELTNTVRFGIAVSWLAFVIPAIPIFFND